MDLDGYPLGLLVSILDRVLEDAIEESLQAAGFDDITRSQGVVFDTLDPGGSRITDMAARARITVQAMGELVDGLQRRGYVERRPDPADGRAKLVVLTAEGERAAQAAIGGMLDLDRRWAEVLGDRPAGTFRRHLQALVRETGAERVR